MATSSWLSDSGFNSGSGSNQFFPAMPQMPSPGNSPGSGGGGGGGGFTNPDVGRFNPSPLPAGVAPNQTPSNPSMNMPGGGQPLQFTGPPGASGMTGIGKNLFAQNPMDPALTSQLFQWLQSQIGQGVPGFNLSTLLPSSGQATPAGSLNAPLNEVMKNIMAMFDPTSGSLGKLASGGIDATPIWQKTIDAMDRGHKEGAANLREQFNFAGNLSSSPFGQAMTDYELQSNKDQDALLANMQFQGISDQMQAAQMQGGFGEFLQNLDQQSIQNMLQEFIRTSPQYNPLLGMDFGAATTFPPVLSPPTGAGGIGALLSGAGGAASGIAALLPAIAALCWVAEVIYGVDDIRTHTVRAFLLGPFGDTFIGSKIVFLYKRYGKRVAAVAKKSSMLRMVLKPVFNWFLKKAKEGKYAGSSNSSISITESIGVTNRA